MKTLYISKLKREKEGACNICRRKQKLTWDHVPPRGGIELTSVQIRSVFSTLTGNKDEFKSVISQNGLKYRTICGSCNATIGHKYDTVLNDFALSVGRYLKSQLSLPPVVQHLTKPAGIIRAVLAHLVASKIVLDEALFDRDVTPAILDETKPIPANIHIYYWVYPYEQTVVMRDFAISYMALGDKQVFGCQLLKYFPIAYLVTDSSDFQGLEELTVHRNASLGDEIAIPIQLAPLRPFNWPEAIDDGKIILGGRAMMDSPFVSPRKRSGQPA